MTLYTIHRKGCFGKSKPCSHVVILQIFLPKYLAKMLAILKQYTYGHLCSNTAITLLPNLKFSSKSDQNQVITLATVCCETAGFNKPNKMDQMNKSLSRNIFPMKTKDAVSLTEKMMLRLTNPSAQSRRTEHQAQLLWQASLIQNEYVYFVY
jgi:hypothetical protein